MSRNLLPWTNFKICSYCSFAWPSLTRSILFCKIRMCFSFMISIAAKCSDVCGWGHDSFPAKQTLHSYFNHQTCSTLSRRHGWSTDQGDFAHYRVHTNNIDFVCLLTLEMAVHLRSSSVMSFYDWVQCGSGFYFVLNYRFVC